MCRFMVTSIPSVETGTTTVDPFPSNLCRLDTLTFP